MRPIGYAGRCVGSIAVHQQQARRGFRSRPPADRHWPDASHRRRGFHQPRYHTLLWIDAMHARRARRNHQSSRSAQRRGVTDSRPPLPGAAESSRPAGRCSARPVRRCWCGINRGPSMAGTGSSPALVATVRAHRRRARGVHQVVGREQNAIDVAVTPGWFSRAGNGLIARSPACGAAHGQAHTAELRVAPNSQSPARVAALSRCAGAHSWNGKPPDYLASAALRSRRRVPRRRATGRAANCT